MRLQQILHVLCDTENKGVILSHFLPHGKEEVCGVFVPKKQIDLVNEDIRLSSLCSVLGDTVENAVKHNKHTDWHELLSEFVNVIADETAAGIHVENTSHRDQDRSSTR